MKKTTIQNIKSIIIAIVLFGGVGFAMATTSVWTPAPASPPGNNVPAPINVGGGGEGGTATYTQYKTGLLSLTELIAFNLTVTHSDGNRIGIPAGSVLVADGDNTGKVKWGTGLAVAGNCAPGQYMTGISTTGTIVCSDVQLFQNKQIFDQNNTFVVPAGITRIKVEAWGGGGAGANYAGSAGGGGGYTSGFLTVSPGQSLQVFVGSGGSSPGAAGGKSYIVNDTTLFANGGSGGINFGASPVPGGAGGVLGGGTAESVGSIAGHNGASQTYNGSDGVWRCDGNTYGYGGSGAGGGGAGGLCMNGDYGIYTVGAGNVPGGGGGGIGGRGYQQPNAGNGAHGRVIVWW